MRVVITGATGNVGSALLKRLTQTGEHDVVALARRCPAPSVGDDIQWISLDLSGDEARPILRRAMEGADAVVHLAWAFQPSHRVDYLEAVGVGGTRRVLDAVVSERVGHLVHMSSVAAYARKRDVEPVDENWPVRALPRSAYSLHKVAAEGLLDVVQRSADPPIVTRLRPGIIGQRSAGSALLRYALPAVVPSMALTALPALPLPAGMTVSMTHADDVAEAIVRVLNARLGDALNLAAAAPVTERMIAEALDARLVVVPLSPLRASMAAAWHARVQPVSPGWLDLACAVPALDSSRAHHELGWAPKKDAREVLAEIIAGMRLAADGATPTLRRRTVLNELSELVRRGPVSHRREP